MTAQTQLRAARVLVVDDDFGVVRLLRDILSKRIQNVDIASSAKECFERIAAAAPDLLILDLMLPDVNGLDVLQRLKSSEQTAKIPVVVISTITDKSYQRRALELGAREFLHKPFAPIELRDTVERLLSQ